MARLVKASLGFATGVSKTLVFTVIGFVVTPIVLRLLGDEAFAAYRMLLDWFALPAVITGAIFASLSGAATSHITKGDWQAARIDISDALRRSIRVGGGIAVAGVLVTVFIPYLIPVEKVNLWNIRMGGLLFAAKSVLLPAYVFRVVLDADQQSYLVNIWEIGRSLIYGALAVLFAHMHWGVAGQALAFSLGELTVIIALFLSGVHRFPGIFKDTFQAGRESNVAKLFGASLVVATSMKLAQTTDNLIVGMVAGAESVTNFFLTQRLVVLVSTFVILVAGSSWAGLLQIFNEGDLQRFEKRLLESTHLISCICWALLVPTLIYNEAFISAWVGAEHFSGVMIGIYAALNLWLINIFGLWGWLINGQGLVRSWAPYAVAVGITNITISITLTFINGPIGALQGTAVGLLAVNSWAVTWLMRRHFQADPLKLWWAVLKPACWGIPLYYLCAQYSFSYWQPTGFMSTLVSIGALSCIGMSLNWLTVMSSGERQLWRERVQILTRLLVK